MFNKNNLNDVIKELREKPRYFVSEAHLQTTFAIKAYELFNNGFAYYLEYPINGGETDLVIIDCKTKEKTHIEFKRKTCNGVGKNKTTVTTTNGISYEPSNMGAQDLGRYDCWKDIERIEQQKENGNCANGFFIFLTNDEKYLSKPNSQTFGDEFSMEHNVLHKCGKKDWRRPVKNIDSIGKKRDCSINIKSKYQFKYEEFQNGSQKYDKTWILVVEI